MPQTYPNTFKNCSTCSTWSGEREVNESKKSISINSSSTKGSCQHSKGQVKIAFMNCEKWSAVV